MYIRVDGNINLPLFSCSLQFRGTQKVSWICLLFLSWGRQGSWLWCKYIFLCLPVLFLEPKHSVEFLRIFFNFVSTSKLYVVNANSVMVLTWCRWPVTSHLVWGFKSCFCSKFWIDSSTNHIWRAEEKLIFIGSTYYFLTEFVWTRKKPYKEIFTWPCHLILRSRFSEKRSS